MKNLNYEIIDNFLDKKSFKELKQRILGNEFSWFYNQEGVSGARSNDSYYFTHLFFWHKTGYSKFYDMVKPIIEKLNPEILMRVKANFFPCTKKIYEHGRHQDFDFKHRGFIFYLNTNDGFTRLKDRTKIQTIENRGLFFDSSVPHNSTTCTNAHGRININFNYLK